MPVSAAPLRGRIIKPGSPSPSTEQHTVERRPSPPLHVNICGQEPALYQGASPALLSLSPGLPRQEDYQPGRRLPNSELLTGGARLSPVQLQHPSSFCRPVNQDDRRKSESPNRKRRRVSCGGHQMVDLAGPPLAASPPPGWGDLSGRRRLPPLRRSPPQRRNCNIYCGDPLGAVGGPPPLWPDHHHHHHQQPPPVVDVNQVPVSLSMTLPTLYTAPRLPPCQVQNLYSCHQVAPQFGTCVAPPQFRAQQPGSGFSPQQPPNPLHHQPPLPPPHYHHPHHLANVHHHPLAHPHLHPHTHPHLHHPHHLATQRPESNDLDLLVGSDLHRPSPPGLPQSPHQAAGGLPPSPPLYLSEGRSPGLELFPHRVRRASSSARRLASRRWRIGPAIAPVPPGPPPPHYPGLLLHFLAMFSSPPLSPFGPAEVGGADSPETENYEALLSLAERLGEAKPRGLIRAEIEQLPSYKFNPETRQSEQTSCVVCMCDFEVRQLLRVLPCSHEFHAKCVDKWLKSNRTCPICRGDASEYFANSD